MSDDNLWCRMTKYSSIACGKERSAVRCKPKYARKSITGVKNIDYIIKKYLISEDVIIGNLSHLNMDLLCQYQHLSVDFLEKYRRINKSLLANRSPIWRVNKLLVLVFRSIAPLWRVNGAKEKLQ